MTEGLEALAVCRHCRWGKHRDNSEIVLDAVEAHSRTGHDIDVRFYNPDREALIQPDRGNNGKLNRVEESGEF